MLKFLSSVVLVFASVPCFASWNLNDVSYLMPLPTNVNNNQLLQLGSAGGKGALLPAEMLKKVPALSIQRDDDTVMRSLRVLAMRLDPCFPLPVPQACQKQVRLVWQPLEVGRSRAEILSVDAALHSFYVLTDAEFDALLRDVQSWKTQYQVRTDGLPLQVHPAWAQERDQSPALQDFQKLILKYAGRDNLSRVTAMVLRGMGDMWAFAGFGVTDGQLTMLPIPRINRLSQAFVNQAIPADHFENAMVAPMPNGEDTFNTLMRHVPKLDKGEDELIRNEMKALYRVENPHNFNPENMDCVSCHVAQPARVWILKNRPDLNMESVWSQVRYQNPRHNLENVTPEIGNTQMIRAFGYFGSQPSVSQRAINESSEVADAVSAYLQ